MHNQRKKNFEFKNIEKSMQLNKENQLLLNRLIQVHNKGHHNRSVARVDRQKKLSVENPHMYSEANLALKSRPFRPRSLNINARMYNDMKIREENIRIAKRLFDKKPVLDFKSLKEEFLAHKRTVKQMMKIKPKKAKHKGRINHLPPMPHSKPMSVDNGYEK